MLGRASSSHTVEHLVKCRLHPPCAAVCNDGADNRIDLIEREDHAGPFDIVGFSVDVLRLP
jgi:hypothetical protein